MQNSLSNYFFQQTGGHHSDKQVAGPKQRNHGLPGEKISNPPGNAFHKNTDFRCLFNVKVASILPQFETLLDWMEIQRVSMSTSSGRSINKKRERSVKENRAHFVPKGDIGWFCLQLPLISDDPEFCWICGACLFVKTQFSWSNSLTVCRPA